MKKIVEIKHVFESLSYFEIKLKNAVDEMQAKGLDVEINHTVDGLKCSAIVIGRKREEDAN